MLKINAIKTRIITEDDDIADIIYEYVKPIIGAGDLLAVAESVVAIAQGRIIRHEEIKVSWPARLLCRLVPQKGSMSSIYGFQAVMDAEGGWRVISAMVVGLLAKCLGMSGVFYRLAGEQSRLIDDITGTMPPYDKYMVLGPADPDQVAEKIKQRLGCYGAAVADVNDLKKSLIVGATAGIDKEKLRLLLIDNPFGNDSQKTPICIIKNYAECL